MGLVELLQNVDEGIWKQFENVTLKAEKELGWSKYDCARVVLKGELIADTAWVTYLSAHGWLSLNTSEIIMGGVLAPLVFYSIGWKQKEIAKKEKREMDLAKEGVGYITKLDALRPIILATSLYMTGEGIHKLFQSPEDGNFQKSVADAMIWVALGSYYTFRVVKDYFVSQIPRPPSSKKTVWQYLIGKMGFGPTGVVVPVENDSRSTVYYESIDKVVT